MLSEFKPWIAFFGAANLLLFLLSATVLGLGAAAVAAAGPAFPEAYGIRPTPHWTFPPSRPPSLRSRLSGSSAAARAGIVLVAAVLLLCSVGGVYGARSLREDLLGDADGKETVSQVRSHSPLISP